MIATMLEAIAALLELAMGAPSRVHSARSRWFVWTLFALAATALAVGAVVVLLSL
ncbi:MAG: hypothetical protein ACKOYN_07420 [Planctomycetota bacterium]